MCVPKDILLSFYKTKFFYSTSQTFYFLGSRFSLAILPMVSTIKIHKQMQNLTDEIAIVLTRYSRVCLFSLGIPIKSLFTYINSELKKEILWTSKTCPSLERYLRGKLCLEPLYLQASLWNNLQVYSLLIFSNSFDVKQKLVPLLFKLNKRAYMGWIEIRETGEKNGRVFLKRG